MSDIRTKCIGNRIVIGPLTKDGLVRFNFQYRGGEQFFRNEYHIDDTYMLTDRKRLMLGEVYLIEFTNKNNLSLSDKKLSWYGEKNG